jgi:uncharacterized protein
MVNLVTAVCLIVVLLMGGTRMSWAADYQKGLEAAQRGDFATALREWHPLAEQGNADAQYNLGVMYRKGEGVTQNDKEAVKWYRLAAEQGNVRAQFNLGLMHHNGDGVVQDYKEAVKLYRLAAEQVHATAQFNLGVMYANGDGVIQDNVMAYMWLSIAPENGLKQGRVGAERGGAENWVKNRDNLAKYMTAAQLAEAQKLARECIARNYRGC